MPSAIAIGAHPDDIEFQMAGTLLLLKQAGFAIHYLNLSRGHCGSVRHTAAVTRRIRRAESRKAAALLGARWHEPFCEDLEVVYDVTTLRRLAAVVREVKPRIVLTHAPVDYMEDHTNTCRLVVTAAFAHGMPNFATRPARKPFGDDVTLYHCVPHGLRDPLRRRVVPAAFVNTTRVHGIKLAALEAHKSQQGWLDASQGLDSYVRAMEEMSRELGRAAGTFTYAEAWWRRLHLGFSATDSDPLAEALGADYAVNPAFDPQMAEIGGIIRR